MPRLLWILKQHVGPSPRRMHAAAFDTRRNRMVLFGGQSPTSNCGDTWEWDGENWTQVNDLGPTPRFGARMAYNPTRQRTVLFGGFSAAGIMGDTWEWNGEDWTQMADSGPSARTAHALVFDSSSNRSVLFGGLLPSPAPELPFADTWTWNGDEWVHVQVVGPSPRYAHAMTFDPVRRRTVLFGGSSGTAALGDTWEFDGTVWTQMTNFGPPACLEATLIYNGRRALLYGGVSPTTDPSTVPHSTWGWDGKHWTVHQDLGPGARSGHTMVFDSHRNRGVLFVGGETWEQLEQDAMAGTPDPVVPV